MRFIGWVAAVSLFAACGEGRVQHDAMMQFGDVAIGASRDVALTLTLSSSSTRTIAFEMLEGDFTVEETSRSFRANETSTLLVRFTPTQHGRRIGTLRVGGNEIALTGSGTGPQITAEHPVVLPPITFLANQIPQPTVTTISVRNTGTPGSQLVLRPPRVAGTELCVGRFVGSVCERWIPPARLGTDEVLEVPLAILPVELGARSWVMVFPSNDPLEPEIAVEVIALVEVFEVCEFDVPFSVVMRGAQLVLPITHLGTRRCLIQDVTVTSSPENFLQLIGPASLPLKLNAGETFNLEIGLRLGAPSILSGVVRIDALGSASRHILVQRERTGADCLEVSASELDYGTLFPGCGRTRNASVYNTCAEPIVIDSLQLTGTTEFELVQGIAPGTVVRPNADSPPTFAVTYAPTNVGSDLAHVRIGVRDAGFINVVFTGLGEAPRTQVDTYRDDPPSVVDVLIMVDSSPSFVPRRAVVRENLRPLLWALTSNCIDARVGIAAADGAPDAGVRPLLNDAGVRWTSSGTPAFAELVLSALDALPVGSEVEACVGPAADVMEDAGVRPGSQFSGFCITDALEQSPNPLASLQRIQSVRTSWNVVSSFGASCSAESLDDGVHQSLIDASNGWRNEICDATWFSIGTACISSRGVYYLNNRPTGPVEVRVDGQLIPGTQWTLDAAGNSVSFSPGRAPTRGETIEISYVSLMCGP